MTAQIHATEAGNVDNVRNYRLQLIIEIICFYHLQKINNIFKVQALFIDSVKENDELILESNICSSFNSYMQSFFKLNALIVFKITHRYCIWVMNSNRLAAIL